MSARDSLTRLRVAPASPELATYRRILSEASPQEAGTWSAKGEPWSFPKLDGSGRMTVRPPEYVCVARVLQETSEAVRRSLRDAGVLEHRALVTGSDADVSAYMESLRSVDAALAAYWAAAAHQASLRSDVSQARMDLVSGIDKIVADRNVDSVRQRRALLADLQQTGPLLPVAQDNVASLPSITEETNASFDTRKAVGSRRQKVEAKLKAQQARAVQRRARPRAGRE